MTTGTAPAQHAAPGGTRQRALAVALELFSREGYDAVSMREIAEELGVTKAALYHHFASKEEIARELVGGYLAALDEVVAWAGREPRPGLDEVLNAWVALVRTQGMGVIRFIHANQRVVRALNLHPPKGPGLRIDPLVDAIAGPDAGPEARMRVRMALFAVNTAALAAEGLDTDEDEAFRIAVRVAREIVRGPG
jgi:AcrR family transcriptional regulator